MDHNFLFYNQEDGCCLTGKGSAKLPRAGVIFLAVQGEILYTGKKGQLPPENRD